MKTQKQKKQFALTADLSKLLFNFNKAYENKKVYTKLTADLKDSAVTIVDANGGQVFTTQNSPCLLYTSPSPRDRTRSRMPSSA